MMKKTALVMAVCLGLTISFPGAVRAANGSTIKVVSMDELEKDYPELGNPASQTLMADRPSIREKLRRQTKVQKRIIRRKRK